MNGESFAPAPATMNAGGAPATAPPDKQTSAAVPGPALSPSAEQQQFLQQQALIIMHMPKIRIIDSMVNFSLLRRSLLRRMEILEKKNLMEKKMKKLEEKKNLMEVEDALVRLDIKARGHHLELKEAMNRSIIADDAPNRSNVPPFLPNPYIASIDADELHRCDDELLAELDGLIPAPSPSAEQQQLLQQQALIIMHMENIMIIDSMVTFSLLRSMRRGEEEKDLMTLMEVEDALVRLDIEARGHHLKLKEAMNRSIDADDDKLLSELYVFEEELATDLSKVDLGRAVGVPSAPISFYSQAAMNLFGAKKKPQSSAPLGASLAQPPVVPAPLSAHLPAHRIDGGRARSPVPQRRHRRPCSTRRRRWPY